MKVEAAMKLQIAFRSSLQKNDYAQLAMVSGLIEVPKASVKEMDGRISTYHLKLGKTDSGLAKPSVLSPAIMHRTPETEWGEEVSASTPVGDLVTQSVWTEGHPGHCELFMRETRVEPSTTNAAVMCYAGLVHIPFDTELDEDHVFQMADDLGVGYLIEGRLGKDVKPAWDSVSMKEATRGSYLTQFLKVPTWGFGEQPVGLMWHGSLELGEMYTRYMELTVDGAKTPEEQEEWGALSTIMRAPKIGLGRAMEDERYLYCLRKIRRAGVPLFDTLQPQTAEMQGMKSEAMRLAIQAMHAEDEEVLRRPRP